MHATTHPPAGLFGVAFLQAMRWALPQLLLATIAAGLVTYVAQSWISPRYVAEARLTVAGADPSTAIEAHVRALENPIRLYSVASELGLQSRPEFTGKGRSQALLDKLGLSRVWGAQELPDADERLLVAVHDRFTAAASDHDGEIAVRFTAADPQLAARFVNRLVEIYLASLRQARIGGSAPGEDSVHVAASAETLDKPVTPRKGAVAMLGMAIVLLLGLGVIATREAFRTAPRRSGGQSTERDAAENPGRVAGIGRPGPMEAAADRLLALPATGRGCRIMAAGEHADVDAVAEACALAGSLSSTDRRAVLVRWALGGGDVNGRQARRGVVGINDLLEGRASFEEIIMRLPDSSAHAIAAGSPVRDRKAALDPDLVSLVLDTLDEVYDYIIVVAGHVEAIALFAALEGRFDACISVGEAGRPAGRFTAGFDRFLGFEVVDIHIVRLERERQPELQSAASPALQTRLA